MGDLVDTLVICVFPGAQGVQYPMEGGMGAIVHKFEQRGEEWRKRAEEVSEHI